MTLEVREGVAHVTLDRPDQGNALDLTLAHGLKRAFDAVAERDDARVVLLTGNGRYFCTGGDLRSMQAADDRGAFLRELALAAHEAVKTIASLEKPVVAAVQGSAAGAGLSLVLLADFVFTTAKTTFVTAYTTVGLTPDCGQSWLLPRAVGTGRALDLMLAPRRVPGADAVALGIATKVVAEDSLHVDAHSFATGLAAGPAHALGAARSLIRSSFAAAFDEHLDKEAATIARLAATEESGKLIDAFLAPKA
ncbi:enoyl-CoA hydratase/isomerase family protein [Streptomyces mexicanus]|uniref:Enoyl-CoA hydratase/isomerase family protein n=1 Tax=Streptomyces mexicanus TaxID=178566 RepID=A0A7X1HXZ0_9ACTN|nr:enoyl-CoA hydratase/isomerase family protein [Streptomyces mexicanus]MBC2864981.1 enoyl-CoA hydratase/isomerase family protein [Streptomyces mexicanus]